MRLTWTLLAVLFAAASPARAVSDGDLIYDIPLRDAPRRGPATAKITIIEFGDFQCPFCARAEMTLSQLKTIYDGEVRLVFKHNPLPFHDHARLASEAAVAAGEQGKFWEMHDELFQNQQRLDRPGIESLATKLGLDMTRFRAALDSPHTKEVIDKDIAEAQLFQATGTPTFFINGRRFPGAQPREKFEALIDQEMKRANTALANGATREQLYEALVKEGKSKADAPARVAAPTHPTVARVIVGDSPGRGATEPKVTIVEWGDFQCPYCARAKSTMDALLSAYPDLRLVFKHQPLSFHQNAMPAALAAEAARLQGKFWEFHDLAFANQRDLSRDAIEAWAAQLGLDMDRFHKDMSDPATRARIDADMAAGTTAGATGTPTFFIDGRVVAGAQPYEKFEAVVDDELRKANALLNGGAQRFSLYDRLMTENLANAPKPAPKPVVAEPKPTVVYAVPIGDAAVLGAATAKVTIVEFGDYQCPFCGRVTSTLKQIRDKYGADVRLVFKHNPLPFHPNAFGAAEAALAAGDQGHFWEMHDMLYENQQSLQPADIEAYAQLLQLDMAKFHAALESHQFKPQIERDQQLATAVSASGTPTFFINGRPVSGAQPFEVFDKLIAEEKAHAEKLEAQGIPPNGLYEALLKDSHAVAPSDR